MYVRKTKDIRDEIETAVKNLFAERRTFANSWYNYGLTQAEFDAIVEHHLFTDGELHLMTQLGPRFFKAHETLNVRILNEHKKDVDTYMIRFSPAKLIPDHWTGYYAHVQPTVYDERIMSIYHQRKEAVNAVTKQYDAFLANVLAVWEKAASVNQFVKLWPPGRDLLTRSVVDKLEEKSERSRASKVEVSAEMLASLNAKMLQAKVAS